MLETYPSADAELNLKIAEAVFLRAPLTRTPFILSKDDTPIGMIELSLAPRGNGILSVGILEQYRGNGYGDFFTRSALLRLSELADEISVAYVDDYFLKFGFRQCGDEMSIKSENLEFPHMCGQQEITE